MEEEYTLDRNPIIKAHEIYDGNAWKAKDHFPPEIEFGLIIAVWRGAGLDLKYNGEPLKIRYTKTSSKPSSRLTPKQIYQVLECFHIYGGNVSETANYLSSYFYVSNPTIIKHWRHNRLISQDPIKKGKRIRENLHDTHYTDEQVRNILRAHRMHGGNTHTIAKELGYDERPVRKVLEGEGLIKRKNLEQITQ